MCGIFVSVSKNCLSYNLSTEKLLIINDRLEKRGPDNFNFKIIDNVLFCHSLLSIVGDLQYTKQPVISTDLNFILVFNGEIYNYEELAIRYNFIVNGDTDLLFQFLIKFGVSRLDELDGMFTFAFYSKIEKLFYVCRDRYGIKPLYFSEDDDFIHFSSDLNLLSKLTNNYTIDDEGLWQYKNLRGFFNGKTLYKGISEFPSGNIFSNYSISPFIRKDWFLEGKLTSLSSLDIFELFSNSVDLTIPKERKFATFLSGGLDSMFITYLSKPEFSVTLGTDKNNEVDVVSSFSQRFDLKYYSVLLDENSFDLNLKKIIDYYNEPVTVKNTVNLYTGSVFIKSKDVRVVLGGEGADEIFLGYDKIYNFFLNKNDFSLKDFFNLYSYGDDYNQEYLENIFKQYISFSDPLLIVYLFFLYDHLRNLFIRLDKSTMMSSIEAREVFLRNQFVQNVSKFVLNDPSIHLGKKVFREIGSKYIGDFAFIKKIGFPSGFEDTNLSLKMRYANWFDYNLNYLNNKL